MSDDGRCKHEAATSRQLQRKLGLSSSNVVSSPYSKRIVSAAEGNLIESKVYVCCKCWCTFVGTPGKDD